MTERTLYELGDDLVTIESLLAECDNPDDPEVVAAVDAWLEEGAGDRAEKIDNYCALIADLDALGDARRAEALRLCERAKIATGRADWLQSRLKNFFERFSIPTMETARFRVGVVKNGGKAPVLIAAGMLPENFEPQFRKVTETVDKEALRAYIESGELVHGATIGERGTRLSIR